MPTDPLTSPSHPRSPRRMGRPCSLSWRSATSASSSGVALGPRSGDDGAHGRDGRRQDHARQRHRPPGRRPRRSVGGASRGRRGHGRGTVRAAGTTRSSSPGSCPGAVGRAPTATAGSSPRRSWRSSPPRSSTSTASTPTSDSSRPPASGGPSTGSHRSTSPSSRRLVPPCARPRRSCRVSAATPARGSASSTSSGSSSTRSTRSASPTPTRTSGSRPTSVLLADADAHRVPLRPPPTRRSAPNGVPATWSRRRSRSSRRGPRSASLVDRLRSVAAELDDVARDLRTTADAIDGDPERLAAVQARRAELADLRRRYTSNARSSLAELFAVRDELHGRVADLAADAERADAAEAAHVEALAAVDRGQPRSSGRAAEASPARSPPAVQTRLMELALPEGAGVDRGGRRRSWRRRVVPPGVEPGTAGRRAGQGCVRWRAGAGRCWRCGSWWERRSRRSSSMRSTPEWVGTAARSVGRALAALAESKQVLVVDPPTPGGGLRRRAGRPHEARRRRHDGDARGGARSRGAGARAGADAVGARGQRHRPRPRRGAAWPPRRRSEADDGDPTQAIPRRQRGWSGAGAGGQAHQGPHQAPRAGRCRRHRPRGHRPRRPPTV